MVTKDPEFTLRLMDQLLVKSLAHRECDRKTDECSATMYIGTLSHSVCISFTPMWGRRRSDSKGWTEAPIALAFGSTVTVVMGRTHSRF